MGPSDAINECTGFGSVSGRSQLRSGNTGTATPAAGSAPIFRLKPQVPECGFGTGDIVRTG